MSRRLPSDLSFSSSPCFAFLLPAPVPGLWPPLDGSRVSLILAAVLLRVLLPRRGSPSGDVYVLPPTATAWPTFTPAPTPTAAPPLAPTQTPVPTATAWPRMPSVLVSGRSSSGGPTLEISPTPYGKLHGGDVFLERQVLSVFRGGDLPAYLLSQDWDGLPPPARVVSSDTRYMLWVVVFDFTQAEPDYRMPGFVRWWSFRPGVEPAMMLEAPMTVSAGSPFFYHGLGRDEPGTVDSWPLPGGVP